MKFQINLDEKKSWSFLFPWDLRLKEKSKKKFLKFFHWKIFPYIHNTEDGEKFFFEIDNIDKKIILNERGQKSWEFSVKSSC